KLIAISSPSRGDGKTLSAINLAGALAQAPDAKVVLVEVDVRHPGVGQYLGLSAARGLSSFLLDQSMAVESIIERPSGVGFVVVEEYSHGVEFTTVMRRSELRQLPSRVVPSTEGLLDLCDAHGARGTFFVLGVVAQRYPRLVRTIVERGHEIASHGWDHTLVDALGPVRFREDVRRSKRTLEQASGQAVWGYRAPNYSIRRDTPWAFPTLWEEGYAYDSSIHPIAHDRYGFPDAPRFPHVAITVDGG